MNEEEDLRLINEVTTYINAFNKNNATQAHFAESLINHANTAGINLIESYSDLSTLDKAFGMFRHLINNTTLIKPKSLLEP